MRHRRAQSRGECPGSKVTFLFVFVGGSLYIEGTGNPPDPILEIPPFTVNAVPPAVPDRKGVL